MTKTAISEQSWTRLRASLGLQIIPQWPEPELSIGKWYRKMGTSDCWETKGPAREQYECLAKDIKKVLDERTEFLNEGEPVSKRVTFSPYMTGRKRITARPTIIFCCERPVPRRRARTLVKESGIMERYSGWILGDSSFPPELDGPAVRLAIEDEDFSSRALLNNHERAIFYTPSDRAYGIEVFIKGYSSETGVRRATIGGILRAEGRYYGLTVAHAFTEADLAPNVSEAVEFEFDLDDVDEESESEEDSLVEETSRGSQSPQSETERTVSSFPSNRSEIDLRVETSPVEGSVAQIYTQSLTGTTKTSADPTSVARSQPTTSGEIVKFGDLAFISSSLETFDWALIEIHKAQLPLFNDFEKRGPGPRFLPPGRAAELNPNDAAVIALTASGKILNGILSGTSTYLHVPKIQKFQEVWTVSLKGKLANGDCGTWVIDAQTGGLYGLIISGTLNSGAAYVMPAHYVLDDITATLPRLEVYMGIDFSILSKPRSNEKLLDSELLQESLGQIAELKLEIAKRENQWEAEKSMLWESLRISKDLGDKLKVERDMYQSSLNAAKKEINRLEYQKERLDRELLKSLKLVDKLSQDSTKAINPDQKLPVRPYFQDEVYKTLTERMGNVPIGFSDLPTPKELHDSRSAPPYIAHVRNLSLDTTKQDLQVLLQDCSPKNIIIVAAVDWRSRGFGLVEFQSRKEFVKALLLSGTSLQGATLDIGVAGLESQYYLGKTKQLPPTDPITPLLPASMTNDVFKPHYSPNLIESGTLKSIYQPNESVIPQLILGNDVTTLYIGQIALRLVFPPIKRNILNGIELCYVLEKDEGMLQHRIIFNKEKACYPYIMDINGQFEVSFRIFATKHEITTRVHSVGECTMNYDDLSPYYRFLHIADAMILDGAVRDKEPVAHFLCHRIESRKFIEAKDEFLKVWRDKVTNYYSISFYASELVRASNRELPIALLRDNLDASAGSNVKLDFKAGPSIEGMTRATSFRSKSSRDYLLLKFSTNGEAERFRGTWHEIASKEEMQIRSKSAASKMDGG